MKNRESFGCTTFRKGNYLGRSYDFFCNSVASSVLHTGRIEGVRYESIGMSGSSFNGMIKDKALDGSIDKATMDTLFSSIVDGINEKGVAISTLVVPKGDKGITTGTNPSKPTITARLVSRVVMDKAYSAKHAIKLLSELNIVQGNWNPEYELHWMIADANDTYIVETVNNKLSYLGPSEIEGIEEFYNGELEADIITNFYQTGFKSASSHTYNETVNFGHPTRLYEVPKPESNDDCYYYADNNYVVVKSGEYIRQYGSDNDEIKSLLEDDKYYIMVMNVDGVWRIESADGIEFQDGPLFQIDGTPVDFPPLSEWTEDTGESYSTFEMPITNPTVTPYGAGLERYKIIKDKLNQINGAPSDDEEAMEIINLVQYTTAYQNDTEWYTEFVSRPQGMTNRTELTAIKNTGKIIHADAKSNGTDYRHFYEVLPPTDSSYIIHYPSFDAFNIKSESTGVSMSAKKGSEFYYDGWSAPDPDKWYAEIHLSGETDEYADVSDFHYMKGSEMKELVKSVTTSDYVDGINGFKALYQSYMEDGGKPRVRKEGDILGNGASWHSNHQCVYDLANKTMLVYPSENGEVAYRVHLDGTVEDSAVEIEGASDNFILVEKYYEGAELVEYKKIQKLSGHYLDNEETSCEFEDNTEDYYAKVFTREEIVGEYEDTGDESIVRDFATEDAEYILVNNSADSYIEGLGLSFEEWLSTAIKK